MLNNSNLANIKLDIRRQTVQNLKSPDIGGRCTVGPLTIRALVLGSLTTRLQRSWLAPAQYSSQLAELIGSQLLLQKKHPSRNSLLPALFISKLPLAFGTQTHGTPPILNQCLQTACPRSSSLLPTERFGPFLSSSALLLLWIRMMLRLMIMPPPCWTRCLVLVALTS